MKILGIETSTYSGSIAIVDDDRILGELSLGVGPEHSEKLLPMLDWLLKEIGLERREIQGIVVSVGPGSFTALRVGISTAKGLAFSLGIPVVGVSSLEVLAGNLPFALFNVCPIIDAKKKEVFAAFFRYSDVCRDEVTPPLHRISDDMLILPQKLIGIIHEKTIFIGDGVVLYKDFLKSTLGELAIFCPSSL